MIPQEITLPTNPHPLHGSLCLPDAATALVLLLQAGGVHPGCAHEDNAHLLAAQGFATLLGHMARKPGQQHDSPHTQRQ